MERIGDLERRYVNEVLDGQFRTSMAGKWVRKFEDAFAAKHGAKYGIALCNGTATLHTALAAAGVGMGDEVIVPPLTMAATAFAVLHCGATPVFADIDPDTWCISPASICSRITPRTKAIIPVHIFGMPCDMDAIMDIAAKHNLFVLEDAAQAVGATYKGKLVGTIGHAGSFSFQSSKHLTAGEGGILLTNDEALATKMRKFSGLGYASLGAGQNRITKDDIQKPDAIRHDSVGYNYRPTDLACAVLLAQTERMKDFVDLRVAATIKYSWQLLRGLHKHPSWLRVQRAPYLDGVPSLWAWAILLSEDAPCTWQQFRDKLLELGGDPYYGAWRLNYQEPVFRDMGYQQKGLCPVAESIQPRLMCFKTNYYDIAEAEKQAEILAATIRHFER
jgi:perosamine synthetase